MKKRLFTIIMILAFLFSFMVSCKNTDNEGVKQETENDNVVEIEDSYDEEFQEEEPVVEDFTMLFTGDVMIQRCTGLYDSKGINGIISDYIEEEMVAADMTMINNEFPFSTRGSQHPDKQFTFRVDPKYVSMLQDMGVDVASLANNHALDYMTDSLLDTFTTLDNAGIPYVGAGETKERAEEAIFVEAGGRKIGVLSASRVIPVVECYRVLRGKVKEVRVVIAYNSTMAMEAAKSAIRDEMEKKGEKLGEQLDKILGF